MVIYLKDTAFAQPKLTLLAALQGFLCPERKQGRVGLRAGREGPRSLSLVPPGYTHTASSAGPHNP